MEYCNVDRFRCDYCRQAWFVKRLTTPSGAPMSPAPGDGRCAVLPSTAVNRFRCGSRSKSSSDTAVCRCAQSDAENCEKPSHSFWLISCHAVLSDCAETVSGTDLSGFEMNMPSNSGCSLSPILSSGKSA